MLSWLDKKTTRRRYTRLSSVERIFNEKRNKPLDVLSSVLTAADLGRAFFSFFLFFVLLSHSNEKPVKLTN